ncbi:SigB/SigF/SigG family RNA polymerase sigma factor [Streptomyces alkaliphilus]|uniref:SigB/SigF/SigG family RNA polymerase sigma factor n=1 Tax=Streptomyces alkaliphilus TaxID=1472722 RepID=UPI0027BA7B78|nr:SigB/SigF/SigG family RNA polymerase sigma factor [Streptomyces alkaliphilus]
MPTMPGDIPGKIPGGSGRRRGRRHPHHDAPDTREEFERIAVLPPCPERQRLCRQIVCAWKPMADRIALTYRSRGEDLEDLRQVAALGLVKAVERYDPSRGNAFESFAVPTIVGEVKRHFRDCMWRVHVPRHTQELRNRVRAASRQLDCGLDEYGPPIDRIAEYTGLSEQEVRLGMEAMRSFSTLSLDAAATGNGEEEGPSLLGALGEPDPGFDHVVDKEAVRRAVAGLSERERTILHLRFFGDMSQSRIGEQLGISQMHVSRLLRQALLRIRETVEGTDPGAAGSSPAPGALPTPGDRAEKSKNDGFPPGPAGQKRALHRPAPPVSGGRPRHRVPSSAERRRGNPEEPKREEAERLGEKEGAGNTEKLSRTPSGKATEKTLRGSGGKSHGSGAGARTPGATGPPPPGGAQSRSGRPSPTVPVRSRRTPARKPTRGAASRPTGG